MGINDLITANLPVLNSFDTGEYGLALMEDFKLGHLPLVHNGIYQCLLSEKDLLSMVDQSLSIDAPTLFAPSVLEDTHLHEVLAKITRHRLSLLPVINTEGEYKGAIIRDKLIDILSELCNAESPGSVIIIELLSQDYSLTDIARLVEANNSHIINLLSYTDKDTGRLRVIIKIDFEDASPVIRSLERFNYNVLFYFMDKGIVDDLLQRRMDELLHYMNI